MFKEMQSSRRQKRRALLLVLDGLGAGAMHDAPRLQHGAHTIHHVVSSEQQEHFPMLSALGLFDVAEGRTDATRTLASLGYAGADSYLGHNELLGGDVPDTHPDTVQSCFETLVTALQRAGHTVRQLHEQRALWINDGILISDNLENEAGMAINLAGTLDIIDIPTLVATAEIVRQHVRNPRVIAFASPAINPESILAALHTIPDGRTGITTPQVGFYKDGYQVRHFGVGYDAQQELPHLLFQAGHPVALIGKFADVAAWCDDAIPRRPTVDTLGVLEDISRTWQSMNDGFIAANVQETDLAGHSEDAPRMFRVLLQVDNWLQGFLPTLDENSLFVLTADHGNDPTYGTHHTREYVPVLTSGKLPYALQPMRDLREVAKLIYTFFANR